MADSNVSVTFSASVDDFVGGVSQARAALDSLSQPFADLKDRYAGLGAALRENMAIYADDARMHRISEQEKADDSRAAIERTLQGQRELLAREAEFGELSVAQRIRVHSQLVEAERRAAEQIRAIARQSLDAQQEDCQAVFDKITAASNAQLRGLLAGTTSWRQAFKNILETMLIDFIQWSEQVVTRHLAAELAQTSATTANVAARTTAAQAGASAGLAAQAVAAVRSILTSAAEAFAGVFAFLAPFMGPAAAGPAVGAQATVAAAAGAVASADIGMWQVPGDMLTLIHRNELVMPANEAGAFRSLLSDGGTSNGGAPVHIHPTTTLHVSALDAGSVSQWMKGNSAAMLRAMDESVRHGAHLGLRRLGA